MVDGRVGDDTEGRGRDPLPEDHIFVHRVRLDLLLELDVEDLELSFGCGRSMGQHEARGRTSCRARVRRQEQGTRAVAVPALADPGACGHCLRPKSPTSGALTS